MNYDMKCLNVWHNPKLLKPYCVRYGGRVYRYANYIEAKAKVDSIMQSYAFSNVA